MEFLEKLLDLGDEVKNAAPLSDRIMMGLQTALIGMGVIFLSLMILWAVLSIFKLVFYKNTATDKKEKPAETTVPASASVIAPEACECECDDGEIVAVITAAIASMLDKPETAFKVVSFRRTASK